MDARPSQTDPLNLYCAPFDVFFPESPKFHGNLGKYFWTLFLTKKTAQKNNYRQKLNFSKLMEKRKCHFPISKFGNCEDFMNNLS